jgi:hypothetical protein
MEIRLWDICCFTEFFSLYLKSITILSKKAEFNPYGRSGFL